MGAEDSHPERMERTRPNTVAGHDGDIESARLHLRGSLVREGQQERLRFAVILQEVARTI